MEVQEYHKSQFVDFYSNRFSYTLQNCHSIFMLDAELYSNDTVSFPAIEDFCFPLLFFPFSENYI